MKHAREEWSSDTELYSKKSTLFIYDKIGAIVAEVFRYRDLDNFDMVFENAKRIVACVNACQGISNEALDAGILDDAIALVLNSGKDIGVTWENEKPIYDGVKVWDD